MCSNRATLAEKYINTLSSLHPSNTNHGVAPIVAIVVNEIFAPILGGLRTSITSIKY